LLMRTPWYSLYRLKLLLNSIWAIPALMLMRAIRPIVEIQICRIFSERIGHFTADVSEQICREKFRNPRTLRLFYFGDISNAQWEKMARRSSLRVVGSWLRYLDRWNQLVPGGNAHVLLSSKTQSRDIEGLFSRFEGSISFLDEESALAEGYLRSKGWKVGEPFVCLLVRDSKFLEGHRDPSSDNYYHDYRDSEIETFILAVEWLATQGVWVLRMGKSMARPIKVNSKLVIDYAFDSEKSDLLDIWLFANCTGVISTSSGLDQLAMIYKRPQLYLNALPLGDLNSWANMIWVPKNLRWRESGQKLTISEYLDHNYYAQDSYVTAGITITNLDESEINEAVQEFWWKLCKVWPHNTENLDLQAKFWNILQRWPRFQEMHGIIDPRASIGSGWLSHVQVETLS